MPLLPLCNVDAPNFSCVCDVTRGHLAVALELEEPWCDFFKCKKLKFELKIPLLSYLRIILLRY